MNKEENKVEDKIEKKAEDAKDKGAPKGAVDIIEATPKPDKDASSAEWKEWGKKVDEKLDKLIAACVKEEPPKEPPKKKSIWDEEIV